MVNSEIHIRNHETKTTYTTIKPKKSKSKGKHISLSKQNSLYLKHLEQMKHHSYHESESQNKALSGR